MPKRPGQGQKATDLRSRAEKELQKVPKVVDIQAVADLAKLLHELDVQRVEFEMQNEELRHSREAAEAARDEYSDLFEFAPVGYFAIDPDGSILRVNLTGAALLGTERGKLVGANFKTFVAFEHKAAFGLLIERCCLEPAGQAGDFELMAGGARRHVRIQAVFMERGKHCRLAVLDLSQVRQAESARRESEELSRKIVETSPDCVKLLDDEGRLVFMNPCGVRQLGLADASPVLGQGYLEFWEGSDKSLAMDALESARHGLTGRFTGYCPTVDGRPKWWDVAVAPLTGIPGRSFLVISRDISEQVLSSRNLTQAKEAAEAANRTKSEFLANMSHEIRTPLNGVYGMLQLLQASAPTPEQGQYIKAAMESSQRLNQLLSDILDLAKVEAGKLAITAAPFDLAGLRTFTLELFRRMALEKGLTLEFAVDPGLPPVLVGDSARLQQILFNLIGNAMKFTSQGWVRVELRPVQEEPEGRIGVECVVRDTGIGIPDDRLGDIFDPFVQVEGSTVRRYQGAGLGLAIVRRLVDLMGGDLSVESELGKGTKFNVYLPFALPGDEAKPQPAKPARQAAVARPKVLIADDDETSQVSCKRFLEKSGFVARVASNGKIALEMLAAEPFDVVIMDVQMPIMDGLEATRAIRLSEALEHRPRIPIIALTAHAMLGDREKLLAADMDGYLTKPLKLQELVDEVVGILKAPRGTPPASPSQG